jgi:hypothetical protein
MARSLRPLTTLVIASFLPLLTGSACKKEPPPVVDAGPAPTPTPADTTPTDFQPLTDDAGADAGTDAGTKPKWTGPAQNGNVARLKLCCAQLSAQAKQLGNSPEGGMLQQAANQCNIAATQAGPNGNAPELGAIRMLLQGKNVPNACGNF